MPKVKIISSLFIVVFINFLFLTKYTARFTDYSLLLSLVISIIYSLFYFYRDAIKFRENYRNKIILFAVLGYVLFSVLLFHLFPLSGVNVDRYSVITSFWDSFFQSKYVYLSKSHQGNMPGPMPFYFILALPFYFMHELGYFSIMGLIVFTLALKYSKVKSNQLIIGILMMLGSAFMFWETVSRSNILLNSSLILLSLLIFIKSLGVVKNKHILLNGVIIGLLLSTRNVLIIPYIVLFLHTLKAKIYSFTDMIKISLMILVVFALTFVPFVVNHYQEFLKINPYIIQSSNLMPSWLSLSCVFFTLSALFLTGSYDDVFYFSGLYLFITILTYLTYHICVDGFYNAFYNSTVDISYFLLCIPFFMFYLLSEKKTSVDVVSAK